MSASAGLVRQIFRIWTAVRGGGLFFRSKQGCSGTRSSKYEHRIGLT
jgi:hypothetical protein